MHLCCTRSRSGFSPRLRRLADVRYAHADLFSPATVFSVDVIPRGGYHARRSIPATGDDPDAQCALRSRHTLRHAAVPMDSEADRHLALHPRSLVVTPEATLVNASSHVLLPFVLRVRASRLVRSAAREEPLYQGEALRADRLLPDFRDQVLFPGGAWRGDRKMRRARRGRLARRPLPGPPRHDAEERAREP